jgi:hypothetical protein
MNSFYAAFVDEIEKIAAGEVTPQPAPKPPKPPKTVDPTKTPTPVMKPGSFFGTIRRGHVGA